MHIDLLYQFKCTLLQPLNGCKGLSIGLNDPVLQQKVKFNYFDSFPGNGELNIVKGGLLNEAPLNQQVKAINFNVFLGQSIFAILDESE